MGLLAASSPLCARNLGEEDIRPPKGWQRSKDTFCTRLTRGHNIGHTACTTLCGGPSIGGHLARLINESSPGVQGVPGTHQQAPPNGDTP